MAIDVTSQHLRGASELTMLMPIKQGFINALDTRTYASRLRILMRVVHDARKLRRELHRVYPLTDPVERMGTIYAFRLAVVNNNQLLLAVAFDRPWEPYIRLVWRLLGPLLDPILCNCEGYLENNHDSASSFAGFAAWVRKHQVPNDLFYVTPNVSVEDVPYLRQLEQRQREGDPATLEVDASTLVRKRPEQIAEHTRRAWPAERTVREIVRSLSVLYRLRELYPDAAQGGDDREARLLQRFAQESLAEVRSAPLPKQVETRMQKELVWLRAPLGNAEVEDRAPPPNADIQPGVLAPFSDETHGVMLLFKLDDEPAARHFVGALSAALATQASPEVYCQAAFTFNGLRRLGVAQSELMTFPKEFRDGMAARAGLLGDAGPHHPENWVLPAWNWPLPVAGATSRAASRPSTVRPSTVDVVVQLRTRRPHNDGCHVFSERHPLYPEVCTLAAAPGAQLMSVQPLVRYASSSVARGHFGFLDGISQPIPAAGAPSGTTWNDRVRLGEVLVGHANDRGDGAYPAQRRGSLLDNGTFMVVRKLRQNVAALNAFVGRHAALMPRSNLLAKMMGRGLDGEPLVPHRGGDNDFDYTDDPNGAQCPLQSHIRLANPRAAITGGDPIPRIVRRGMSYGPRFDSEPDADRGLMFVAYNASIAEQFEVVQRWLTAGNSTGILSAQSDPFIGMAEPGEQRTMRFINGDRVVRVDLDAADSAPFVALQWGLYLFVPSVPALKQLAEPAQPDAQSAEALIREGRKVLEDLQGLAALLSVQQQAGKITATQRHAQLFVAWKTVLEDVSARRAGITAALWAAIRADHQGALTSPYGVLVASADGVEQVYRDDRTYSVREYWRRLTPTMGEIYLGMDPDPQPITGAASERQLALDLAYRHAVKPGRYQREALAINALLMAVPEQEGFRWALHVGRDVLQRLATLGSEIQLINYAEEVLAQLCEDWFGLPDAARQFVSGPEPKAGQATVSCPLHFGTPSRFAFSPQPSGFVERVGSEHGAALQRTALAYVRAMRGKDAAEIPGTLARQMFALVQDDQQLANTLIGVMMGFLPTVHGNFLSTMNAWIDDQELWRVQIAWFSTTATSAFERAQQSVDVALRRSMQLRPVPDMVHRTAVKAAKIGAANVAVGDRVVVGISSATQEARGRGNLDVSAVFGGDRRSADAPMHACPAYRMGMGVLLGMVAALLDVGTLTPDSSPLVLGRR